MNNRLHENNFRGCLLGGAIGDALGAPIEFMSTAEIHKRFGPNGLVDYAPAYGRLGAITDDTQMTMFTAEGLLRACNRQRTRGVCNPVAVLYGAYLRWLITQGERPRDPEWPGLDTGWLIRVPELFSRRAPGNTCLSALRGADFGTVESSLNDSKGCGGVMRVAPVGLFYGALTNANAEQAFGMGCAAAAVTHGHPTGYLAAGLFSAVIFHIMRGADLAQAVQAGLQRLRSRPHHEETSTAVMNALTLACTDPDPKPETIERLGGGWIAEEALAIAIYCSLTAQADFRRGVLAAVNHGGDSDSTGSITGNILGALLGGAALPPVWLDQLELRSSLEILARDLLIGHSEEPLWENSYPGI